MFLTQLLLTTQDMIDLRIKDDYAVHKIVYSFFCKEDGNRILYVDKGLQKGHRVLWILSQTKPEIPFGEFETKEVSGDFLNHKRYSFEIVLNPVKKSKEKGKLVAIRIPPKTKENEDLRERAKELLDWFFKKAEQNGFAPDQEKLQFLPKPTQTFSQKNKPEQTVTHNKVLFSGTLTVTDPERFRAAFEQGIGKAKAFGFGLLQLVPIFD
ncbi:MAG: type I-E CRISPR-associated protein Cas6/Cse3/CasE [Thermoguttaceae bacterium]|nr:type I-E CRISPR-associated protein Cas6/Cse3/CasE [Thermoguttaceae bacterium]MBR0192045.1 type I-E CRISPR-associated protein Cas6/Cse3/CasE [Thermoguttaceae bacterium]